MKIVFRPTMLNGKFLRREFLPTLRNCVDAFLILCAVFTAMSLLLPQFGQNYVTLLEEMTASLGVAQVESPWELFSLLLTNNLTATVNAVFYGYLPFLYYPALVLGSNALSIASLAVVYIGGGQLSAAAFFAGILPHGIFEIPALLIACAIGLCNCRLITRMVLKKPQFTDPRTQLVSLSWLFFALVMPLLLLAAAVEVFLTPAVLSLFI